MDRDWGRFRIGNRKFGPLTEISVPITATHDAFQVPRPDGIYRSASIVLESRQYVRAITAPTDVFALYGGLTIPLSDDNSEWKTVLPGTVENYYENYAQAKIWTDDIHPVPFRLVAQYHPELN